MEEKKCSQCRKVKTTDQFYKSKREKDGYQIYCKDCSKENNKIFRMKNPNYYWGTEDSYFVKNYDETMQYAKEYGRANKSLKIYVIETPEGIYIGGTRRHYHTKMTFHKNNLKNFIDKTYDSNNIICLNEVLVKYSIEEAHKMIDNAKIVFEKENPEPDDLSIKRRQYIQHYVDKGYKVLNLQTNPTVLRKKKMVWKYERI